VPRAGGAHYLQYSGLPELRILNGLVQSLVGLYDYAQATGDAEGQALFAAGNTDALEETPTFDTGAWSLYSRGSITHESNLNYHVLLRDFLGSLCTRTGEAVFCSTEDRFTADLKTPPEATLRTTTLRGGTYSRIKVDVSKISTGTLRVERAGKLVYTRSVGLLAYGPHTLGWAVPRTSGDYDVTIALRDLAGNSGEDDGTVVVLPPRKRKT
jgi:hypothetical protein